MSSGILRRRAWHVSPSVNRDSIREHGLDWRRMATTGIALPPEAEHEPKPEADGVFLCEALSDVELFVGFGSHPAVDVWEVDVTGLEIEDGPDGWLLCRTGCRSGHTRWARPASSHGIWIPRPYSCSRASTPRPCSCRPTLSSTPHRRPRRVYWVERTTIRSIAM